MNSYKPYTPLRIRLKPHIGRLKGLLLLASSLLYSCSKDDELSITDPPIEQGYSLVQVRFCFPEPDKRTYTYAPGSYTAEENERELKSIAFIVQIPEQGVAGTTDYVPGSFIKFLSSNDLRSPTGLYSPLTKSGNGYTASIKIRSFSSKARITAIANYVENGLTQQLENIAQYDDIKQIATPNITGSLSTPLLMFDEKEVELSSGKTVSQNFMLERVVARIDVINAVSDPDPAKGFVLESAQVINPRKSSYLVYETTPDDRHKIGVIDSFDEVQAGNPPVNNPLRAACLYTYETDNNESLYGIAPTAIRIKGTYNGIKMDKVIPIKTPDKDGQTGVHIPLRRNHRYAIYLTRSDDLKEVVGNIRVAEWNDGEEIIVTPPPVKTPILSNFEFYGLEPSIYIWNPDTKTLDYTAWSDAPQDLDVSFIALDEYYGTTYDITLLYDKVGKSIDMHNKDGLTYQNFVTRDDPVITPHYILQAYNIKLPKRVAGAPNVPAGVMIRVMSSGNPVARDSVIFRIIPDYDNTHHRPVLVGGKYWAPVNVGALDDFNEHMIDQFAMGCSFQWGRNTPFTSRWGAGADQSAAVSMYQGPVEYHIATKKNIAGSLYYKFINTIGSNNDWLNSNDPNKNIRNNRWKPKQNDSPCPKGWRVPTAEEFLVVTERFEPANIMGWHSFIVGDEYEYLYFPRAGFINRSNGIPIYSNSKDINSCGLYWTSDDNTAVNFSHNYQNATKAQLVHAVPSHGFSIRCIQQDEEDNHS